MAKVTQTKQTFTVDHGNWVLTAGASVAVLACASFAMRYMLAGDFMQALKLVGLGAVCFFVIVFGVTRLTATLDRDSGTVVLRTKSMRGTTVESFALADVTGAATQKSARIADSKVQAKKPNLRPVLIVSGRPEPVALVSAYASGDEPARIARQAAEWLDLPLSEQIP